MANHCFQTTQALLTACLAIKNLLQNSENVTHIVYLLSFETNWIKAY